MKYMGSKRSMLNNGLGKILQAELADKKRFVDLFTGSGAVAWWVATRFAVPVIASDIQRYAGTLAGAVILRDESFDPDPIWQTWNSQAKAIFDKCSWARAAVEFDEQNWHSSPEEYTARAREISSESASTSLCTAYGGYYFSPLQILWIDSYRKALPTSEPVRTVALASLLTACGECAAAPGHTAQPFSPTPTASKYLFEHWRRDVASRVERTLRQMSTQHAKTVGVTKVSRAEEVANELNRYDVAFVDPPYSGVQYSRFYHVLEGVDIGEVNEASGTGRYPSPKDRPQSEYSLKSKSRDALSSLLDTLAEREVSVVLTFPQETASNGLSGHEVEKIANCYFQTSSTVVNGRFSTLGGNTKTRSARIPAHELILTLTPR